MIQFIRYDEKLPVEAVDEATAGTVYVRSGPVAACYIKRIVTVASVSTMTWSYGAWSDRTTLTYAEMNDEIALEV